MILTFMMSRTRWPLLQVGRLSGIITAANVAWRDQMNSVRLLESFTESSHRAKGKISLIEFFAIRVVKNLSRRSQRDQRSPLLLA